MKTISKSFLSILCLVSVMFTTTIIHAQSKSNVQDFVIMVQLDGKNIKLVCDKGCSWTELEFSLKGKNIQTVNQFGITNTESKSQDANINLANFQFTIVKDRKEFVFNGLNGTSWKTLTFDDKTFPIIGGEGILPQ